MSIQLPKPSDYEIEQSFMEFLSANNLSPVGAFRLVINGNIQRYRVEGDSPSEKSGSYCIYINNDWPIGWAEDWHYRQRIDWFYKTDGLNQEQKNYINSAEFKAKAKAAQKKFEAEMKKRHDKAAETAKRIIETTPYASENHPYLQKKHIFPYGVKDNGDGSLAVPIRDIDGNIRSLQWITPDGGKKIMYETSAKGCFWSVGMDLLKEHPALPILLGEGFATMAKCYELTGLPSVAGISCYGLKAVAKALKSRYPECKIVCMADNDKATEIKRGNNPGLEAANDLVNIGLAVEVVYPEFPDNDGTDWDDYAILFGDEATAQLLKNKITWATMSEQERHEYNTRKSLSGIIHELDPSIDLPPQEFIGGLFPRKFVSLLIAPPGTGKTIFMQKFVSDLSMGGSIFDGFAEDEPPRMCLILAGEAGYELLIRRGASMKWPVNPKNVKVLDQYEAEIRDIPIMLDNPEGWQNVLRLVDMYKPDIVFFDTLSSFHEGDENKATEMKPLIKKMATLARNSNIAVVPVHHSRKRLAKERTLSLNQDDVIGSSIINRLVGLIIGIEPMKEDEKVLLVHPLKSWFSSFMPFTYTLKENFYGGTTVQTDLAPIAVNNSKIAVWNYLLATFSAGEWFTRAQIVMSEIEGNITERQVRYILAEFVKNGKLQSRGKNKSQEYSLP